MNDLSNAALDVLLSQIADRTEKQLMASFDENQISLKRSGEKLDLRRRFQSLKFISDRCTKISSLLISFVNLPDRNPLLQNKHLKNRDTDGRTVATDLPARMHRTDPNDTFPWWFHLLESSLIIDSQQLHNDHRHSTNLFVGEFRCPLWTNDW